MGAKGERSFQGRKICRKNKIRLNTDGRQTFSQHGFLDFKVG
jgi:hypothetical protein